MTYMQLFADLIRVFLQKPTDEIAPTHLSPANTFCFIKELMYVIESKMDGYRYF